MDKQIDSQTIKRRRNKRLIRGGAVCTGILVIIYLCVHFLGGKSLKGEGLLKGVVDRGPLQTAVNASGRFEPAVEEIVNSPVSSRIVALYAHPGDTVQKGTPLLELDLEESETQLRNMADQMRIQQNELDQLRLSNKSALSELEMKISIKEMEVNRLSIDVANEKRLDSLGSGTGDRVRAAETAYTTGCLELEGLRMRLVNERARLASLEEAAVLKLGNSSRDYAVMERTVARGRIPAPLDGVLTFLSTSIGSTVAVGEKVAVVSDLSSFKVVGDVPETSSFKIKPGATTIVRSGSEEFEGIVNNIEPQARNGSVQFTVLLTDSKNPHIRPGQRVQIYVDYGFKESVVRIPSITGYKGPGGYIMFVDDGSGTLQRRKILLGDSNRKYVEVVRGLEPGETVILSDLSDYENKKSLKIK